MSYAPILYMLLVAAITIALTAVRPFYGKKHVLSLNWDANQDYFVMRKKVMKYFRLHGWKVASSESTVIDFIAFKSVYEVWVKCLPSTFSYTHLKLRDLYEIKMRRTRSHPLVCVCAITPIKEYAERAEIMGIRIVHYKELFSVASADPRSFSKWQPNLQPTCDGK